MAFIYDLTDTWNAGGTTFSAIKMNVTDTASAAASKLVQCQISGTDKFTVGKDGGGYFAGNVGIGTSSPTTSQLHVYTNTDNAYAARFDQDHPTGWGVLIDTDATVNTDPALWVKNATDTIMWAGSGGNVGIGTTSPSAKLHVSDAANGKILISGTSTSAELELSAPIPKITFTDTSGSAADGEIKVDGNAMQIAMGGSERMRIDSSGNVGIGVTPAAVTHGPHLDVGSTRGTVSIGTGYIEDNGTTQFFNGTRPLAFGTAGSERMRIDSAGNVGIGTNAPATLTSGITALSISDSGAKTTGDKIGELNFVTDDGSFTGTFSDGIGAAINAVATSATGAAYGLTFTTATITGSDRAERMRIDSSGNVGIGTSSPDVELEVSNSSLANAIRVGASSGARELTFQSNASAGTNTIISGGDAASTPLLFSIGPTGSATERMRIDSSGNLLVGRTTTLNGGVVSVTGTATQAITGTVTSNANSIFQGFNSGGTAVFQITGNGQLTVRTDALTSFFDRKTSDGAVVSFQREGSTVGSISVTTTATTYNTSSDARLKENIAPADDAAALIDAIQVRKFDWKADGSHQRYGMVAQELLEVAPEAVSVPADEDQMMGVDYSKLVPMLIKEIQSMRLRLAQLEG